MSQCFLNCLPPPSLAWPDRFFSARRLSIELGVLSDLMKKRMSDNNRMSGCQLFLGTALIIIIIIIGNTVQTSIRV